METMKYIRKTAGTYQKVLTENTWANSQIVKTQ